MSLVDEVLAKHGGDTYNCAGCLPNFAVSPCESVRLALSLRAADIAIEGCKACDQHAAENYRLGLEVKRLKAKNKKLRKRIRYLSVSDGKESV